MTVINMMSFGESGAAVADEQSSRGVRKQKIAQKLKIIDNSVIYGGSGVAQIIKEVSDCVTDYIKKERKKNNELDVNPDIVYRMTKGVMSNIKNDKKDYFIRSNFGIGLEDLQSGAKEGKFRLDDEFKKRVTEASERHVGELYSAILIGGLSEGKFEIYALDSSGNDFSKMPSPYESIGSGKDESDKILSQYVENLRREKRDNILVEEGLVKLIEATNGSSNLNIGVGGNPSIIYMDENGFKKPNEKQCLLASEIVEGYSRGLLEKKFVYGAVHELVLNDGNFEKYEEEMKQSCKDWKKLDRILRGYKE